MKILQLCNKPPYPTVDGGTMAMNSVTQGLLRAGHTVRVLTVETDKHPLRRDTIDDYARQTQIEAVHIDTAVKPLPAALALLTGESYNVQRFRSEAFAKRLREILQTDEYDIIHVESIFLTPYLPLIHRHTKAKVILRAHNVEHLIWRRVAESAPWGAKRWYLKHIALSLRAYELEHISSYDGVVCITRADADYFRANGLHKPTIAIPFGVEPEEIVSSGEEPASLFHIGAMDWLPNRDGIEWMLDEVWPLVHEQVPQAKLYIAGRKMPQKLMESKIEGVVVVGEVDDAARFIAGKKINVVPLRSGSGIRVKIIEAMSMGKAVVSTSIGAAGIEYTDGRDILIANTPQEFADKIKRLVEDTNYCDQIGTAAARLIEEQYNIRILTDKLTAFYTKIIET